MLKRITAAALAAGTAAIVLASSASATTYPPGEGRPPWLQCTQRGTSQCYV